jgi:heparin/heparan-sulfate lyase
MKVNLYNFNNHQHLDAGAFQIYYKGPLAIDSGIYSGVSGSYDGEHHLNYSTRTVAHNCLLVYDPAETFTAGRRTLHNDGGQRLVNGRREPNSLEDVLARYRTADVLAQGFGPDPHRPAYTYLRGDLTKAYGPKLKAAERSFVFLNLDGAVRAALLVFDRVVSADPAFRKYWLVHSMEEPRIEGDSITLAPTGRGWSGKLVNRVLIPEKARIEAIGGPGKEFWVFGRHFAEKPRNDDAQTEIGDWRVEVSPSTAAAEDLFLNVMQVMDRASAPLPVKRVDAERMSGAMVSGIAVLFPNRGGHVDGAVRFRSEGARFLATGLTEGTWQVWRDGAVVRPAVRVSGEEGTLWFEGPAGHYELRR